MSNHDFMQHIADGLLILLIALQVIDYLTTQRAIQYGAKESNIFLVTLEKWLGDFGLHERWLWLALPKIALIGILLVAYVRNFFMTPGGFVILVFANIAYTWVAFHNWRVMDQMREKSDHE